MMPIMMPCSFPRVPGAFVRPGANSAAAASDPSLAAVYNAMHLWTRRRPQEWVRYDRGLDVEVRLWLNLNGGIEQDIREEYRRAARLVVMLAVQRACAR